MGFRHQNHPWGAALSELQSTARWQSQHHLEHIHRQFYSHIVPSDAADLSSKEAHTWQPLGERQGSPDYQEGRL